MANTSNRNSSEFGVFCQYYLQGRCRFGSGCRNLHPDIASLPRCICESHSDDSDSDSSIYHNACEYYLDGRCRYGDDCWYPHPEINEWYSVENSGQNNIPRSDDHEDIDRESASIENSEDEQSSHNEEDGDFNEEDDTEELTSVEGEESEYDSDVNETEEDEIAVENEAAVENQVAVIENVGVEESQILGTEANRICRYYLEGTCRFGSICINLHPDSTNNSNNIVGTAFGNEADDIVSVASTSGSGTPCSFIYNRKCLLGTLCRYCPQTGIKNTPDKVSNITTDPSQLSCGICLDLVLEKDEGKRKFGILPNCNHCFCFDCIKTWRVNDEFEKSIRHGCPECRVASDFIVVNDYWVEANDKENFIIDYRLKLSKLHCRSFRRGNGKCRFGDSCMYLHALPDGTKVNMVPLTPAEMSIFMAAFEEFKRLLSEGGH